MYFSFLAGGGGGGGVCQITVLELSTTWQELKHHPPPPPPNHWYTLMVCHRYTSIIYIIFFKSKTSKKYLFGVHYITFIHLWTLYGVFKRLLECHWAGLNSTSKICILPIAFDTNKQQNYLHARAWRCFGVVWLSKLRRLSPHDTALGWGFRAGSPERR